MQMHFQTKISKIMSRQDFGRNVPMCIGLDGSCSFCKEGLVFFEICLITSEIPSRYYILSIDIKKIMSRQDFGRNASMCIGLDGCCCFCTVSIGLVERRQQNVQTFFCCSTIRALVCKSMQFVA